MKNIIITIVLLLNVSANCFSYSDLSNSNFIDQYFITYHRSDSWQTQRVWLFNFALALKDDPNFIGYIGFESSKRESVINARFRINRSVKYLTESEKIEKNRIVVIYIGKSDNPRIILQPVTKGISFHF